MITDIINLYREVIKLDGARIKYSGKVLCIADYNKSNNEFFKPLTGYTNLRVKNNTKIKKSLAEKNLKVLTTTYKIFEFNNPKVNLCYNQIGRYLIIHLTDELGIKFKKIIKLYSTYRGKYSGVVEDDLLDNYSNIIKSNTGG